MKIEFTKEWCMNMANLEDKADAESGKTMDKSTQEAAPPIAWASDALRDVAAERRRQIEAEDWTPEHDDEHEDGELALAGAAYAVVGYTDAGPSEAPAWWPWDAEWWKPKDKRRNLVKAAALLLAEIERLDRAAG
jgi:hypothetical protein